MSNLSDLLPAGASAKEATFTASGAISSGDTVILNSDGTVTAVGPVSSSVGSLTTFESATTSSTAAVYHAATGKIIVAYNDGGNSSYGTAVAGTVSGSSISFGTPYVFKSNSCNNISATYDANAQRTLIAYHNYQSNYGESFVAYTSGTSVTVSGPYYFKFNEVAEVACAYDSGQQKVVVQYKDYGNSFYSTAVVGTISGDTITYGSALVYNSSSALDVSMTYDSAQGKILFVYADTAASQHGKTNVGTVSGTSITATGQSTFYTTSCSLTRCAYDSNSGKVVIIFKDGANSRMAGLTCTISGNSTSFGTKTTISPSTSDNYSLTYDAGQKKCVVFYRDTNNSPIDGQSQEITVSGTNLTSTSQIQFNSAASRYNSSAYDSSARKVVVACRDDGTNTSRAAVYTTSGTNITPTNFLGIAKESIANAASGEVVLVGGISENATSEVTTTNSTVYVQNDGTLSTTVSSVEAGLAFGALGTPLGYSLSNAAYNSVSFGITQPHTVRLNNNGTKAYFLLATGSASQYSLTTAYDISTATTDSKSFSFTTQDASPRGITFNGDGTKVYMVGYTNATVYQYSLSTAFDISTASYDSVSFSLSSQGTQPDEIIFNNDGTKFYVCMLNNETVFQYSLSSAYDMSTATYDSVSLDVSGQSNDPRGIALNGDGTKFFVLGEVNDAVYQYSLGTAYSLSGASYDSVSFDVSGQVTLPTSLVFGDNGAKMYIAGYSANNVYQYTTEVNTTSKLLLNG